MKNKLRLTLLSVLRFFSRAVSAATSAGRIEGRITDPKGAGVPGATVTVTSTATKQVFTAVADDQGLQG
jgi:hypothetical protein